MWKQGDGFLKRKSCPLDSVLHLNQVVSRAILSIPSTAVGIGPGHVVGSLSKPDAHLSCKVAVNVRIGFLHRLHLLMISPFHATYTFSTFIPDGKFRIFRWTNGIAYHKEP